MWEFYSTSTNPVRQACVKEWQLWLDEVPSNADRSRLAQDLKSDEVHKHYSTRLELYFHHLFKSQGDHIEIHPNVVDATTTLTSR